MAFSLDQFYRINRRALLWVAFFALLYLLRDFFGLIFVTFFLCFVGAPITSFFERRGRFPRQISVIAVYLLFFVAVVAFSWFVPRQVVKEASTLTGNLDVMKQKIVDLKNSVINRYPSIEPPLADYLRNTLEEQGPQAGSASVPADDAVADEPGKENDSRVARQSDHLLSLYLSQQADLVRAKAPKLIRLLWRGSTTLMLSLLFSFLISLDISRLRREIESLRASRLRDFYEEAARPVVRFAYIVGRAIQAQAMIACVNTVLTLIGILILGLPSVATLALIVFICSFIPVLGVFISTIPLTLVALNAGGLALTATVIGLVILIHLIEAYVLNPLIYGHHLNLNPVLILIILFVGHHAFGVWGMLLGVPVAYYVIHDVFRVPVMGVGITVQKDSEETPKEPPRGAKR